MHLESRGPEQFRRYALVHRGRVWDGEKWVKNCRHPALFADATAAYAARDALEAEVAKRHTVTLFRVPIEFHIGSSWPFDVDEMKKFLARRVAYTFGGMEGAPEDARCSFHGINWRHRQIVQHGAWPDPATTRMVVIEAPVKVLLLVTGEINVRRVRDWLKRHVRVDADELMPGGVPIAVAHVGVAWKKAKMADVRKKGQR